MSPQEKGSSGLGALVFTALALIFTGITAWLLAMMLSGTQYTKEPVKPVVVTRVAIEPLMPIQKEHLKVVKVPESTIPDGAFTRVADLVSTPPLRPMVRLYSGEIVVKERLADPESGIGLAPFVPSGMRAMVLRLDVAVAQARLFYPGAEVDVLATMRLERLHTVVSRIILQRVKILAMGTDVDPAHLSEPKSASEYAGSTEDKSTVMTLLVTPEEVEQLTLATREGHVDLVLRSPVDSGRPETRGARPEDLFPSLREGEDDEEDRDGGRKAAVRRILSRPRFRKPASPPPPSVQVQ